MSRLEAGVILQSKCNGTITDFKYSPTGQYLAVADSQGFIHIYLKDKKGYSKINQIKAEDGSIWSISWGDVRYGNIIGVGTFRNRVIILQQNNGQWRQIAYHDLHQASVNWVEFAPCGLKLYAGSSDGFVSILELYHKAWRSTSFHVSDASVACFALQPLPLGEFVADDNAEKVYPRIATVTKDQKIKIWAHENQKFYSESQEQRKKPNESGYYLVRQFPTLKQTIRNILWKPSWGSMSKLYEQTTLLTCSEEGLVKEIRFAQNSNEKDNILTIFQTESQIVRISQSLTGNFLSISIANKADYDVVVYEEVDEGNWKAVDNFNAEKNTQI